MENLETALAGFDHCGTRPGWLKQTRQLAQRTRKLLEAVAAELDS